MFPITWSKKKGLSLPSCNDEGLRLILTTLANANSNYVVVKPVLLVDRDQNDCYLESCHLCHKPLSLDKEIYMYKGDLGFCSVECRDRQIYLDETNDLEMYTKNILSSFRERSGRSRCETYCLSSNDFRKPSQPFSSGKNRVIFL